MSGDPLRYFRVEARELADEISQGVLVLDQAPDPQVIARLLRQAHTLKGAARVVRQPELADLAHELEEVLIAHRDGAAVPPDDIRRLLQLVDAIDSRVAALEPVPDRGAGPTGPPRPTGTVPPEQPGPPGADPAEPPLEPADAAANAPVVARAAGNDVDELLDAVGEAHTRFAPLRGCTAAVDRLRRSAETLADHLRAPALPTVGLARGVGPDALAAAQLARDLTMLGRRLTDGLEQVERELDEVRGRAESLRLVAASSIFTSLHRAVRDAAEAEHKRVVFTAHGGDLRIDPQVLAQAGSALLHMVRNAVAHGIEPQEQRRSAGKPPEGEIVVRVDRRGPYAAFSCQDDGRGFDLDALRRTAEARGLLPPGAPPSPQALVDLVLHGGISTATTVTEVSGRGIGLDVVRDVAQQAGGDVAVRTAPGTGTTVELIVPLSLLSLQGLSVRAGTAVATVPLDSVRTCVRLTPEQAATAASAGRLPYTGEALPFLPLARALGGPAAAAPTPGGPSSAAVIVAAGDQRAALGVDRLLGASPVVVRPLPDLAVTAAVIGGVCLDVEGNPRPVLDPLALVAESLRTRHDQTPAADDRRDSHRLPILVVDDSLTTRMMERSILESAGYEVDLASSGEEALVKARLRPYALFLTDIDMPGMDGFAFLERAHAEPGLAETPAILVSSRSSAEDRERGAEVGAAAYVVKGEFDQQELLDHIRRLVGA